MSSSPERLKALKKTIERSSTKGKSSKQPAKKRKPQKKWRDSDRPKKEPELPIDAALLTDLFTAYDPECGSGGYEFDIAAAAEAIDYVQRCSIELAPWEQALIANVFGWVHKETGARRYSVDAFRHCLQYDHLLQTAES